MSHLLAVRVVALLLAAASLPALADEAADCAANDGTLLTGVVTGAPRYVSGKPLRGIPLSHTHVRLRGDADGKTYDLAIDNVYAAGYQPQAAVVPAPLDTLVVGEHLEACGLPYQGGMHWVHINCGDTPTPEDPNGWLKPIAPDGTVGANLEDFQKYCYLWTKHRAGVRTTRSRHE